MVKVKRLKIHKFRNIYRACELTFQDGINIVLGLNGTGKSTVLNIVSDLLTAEITSIGNGDSYDIEAELRISDIDVFLRIEYEPNPELSKESILTNKLLYFQLAEARRNSPGDGSVKAFIRLSQKNEELVFENEELVFEIDNEAVKCSYKDRSADIVLPTRNLYLGVLIFYIVHSAATALKLPLFTVAYLRSRAYRFEEGLEPLNRITKNTFWQFTEIPFGEAKFKAKEIMVLDSGVSSEELSHAFLSEFKKDVTATTVSVSGDRLKSLSSFLKITGFSSAIMHVELIEKNLSKKNELPANYRYGNAKFYITRKDGSIITHDLLSRGQKRLLAFLLYIDANPDVVIIDELVNDLHYSWIENCLEAIGPRQAFLTSQNPLLLDHLVFESVEQVKKTFVLCYCSTQEQSEELHWRNLNTDESAMFFQAYQAGIQHVSEILRSKRLW